MIYHESRQLALTHNFVDVDAEIKYQTTAGCKSNRLWEKGLTTLNMTLQEQISVCQNIAGSYLLGSMNDWTPPLYWH